MSFIQIDFVKGQQEVVKEYLAKRPCHTEPIKAATGEPASGDSVWECGDAEWIAAFEALDGTWCFTEYLFGDWYVTVCFTLFKTVMIHE